MSEKKRWATLAIRGIVAGLGLAATVGLAQAEQMGRDPWKFKALNNPLALNRAIAIEQQEERGFGTTVFSTLTTNSYSSTSAENFTEIISNCGNDASCVVDAAIARDGAGGAQNSNAAPASNSGQ